MSVDDLDDTSDSPIQFGLADKSLKILQEHSRRLEAMVTAVKGTVGPGAGGQFSGKFLQVANQQLLVQKDIARGMSHLNITMSNFTQLAKMGNKMALIDLAKQQKMILAGMNALTGSGGGAGATQGRMSKVWDFIKGLPGMLMSGIRKGFSIVSKIWEKTGGALFKKTGQMGINKLLGLGGLTVAGALIGKMISSSPLLQAMFKILNTSLTLIMRPIGDFFGAFFRPMFIYFLKEVAIPFFQKGRGWMKDGERWGRIAVGFFIDPIQAIKSGAILAFKEVPFFKLFSDAKAVKEAQFFQKDPAAWLRAKEGLDPLPPFMALNQEAQLEENLETIPILETELEKQTTILEELERIEGNILAQINAGAVDQDPLGIYTGMNALEIFRAQNPGYSKISDEGIYRTSPWTQPDIGGAGFLGSQQIIVEKLTNELVDLKEETVILAEEIKMGPWWSRWDLGASSAFAQAERDTEGMKGWEILVKAFDDFFKPSNIVKFSTNLIGGAGGISPGFGNEPFDEMQYQAELQAQVFTDITRSFVTMEDYNRQSADSATQFFRDVNSNQLSTAQSIEMSNRGILKQYDMTMDELYGSADSLKERLYKVYTVYEAISRNADLISYNDQVTADARALSMELQLGFTEEMLTATTSIKHNYGLMADSILQNYLDIGYFQNISRSAMQEAVGTILKTTDDVSKILTGEPGTLASQYNTMVATQGGYLSSPQISGGGYKGIGGTVQGGGQSLLDIAYMRESTGGYSDIYGYQDPQQTMWDLAGQGKAITASGNVQDFFKYEGPEGQSFDEMWKVPKITGPTGALVMDPNWRKVADAENAFMAAIGHANMSVAVKLNEAAAAIKTGTDAFTTANEAAVYVGAGGGLAGLAAVEGMVDSTVASGNLPGVQTTGPSYGSWIAGGGVSSALASAIAASQAANPGGWAQATGIAQSYFSGGSSGGGGGGGSSGGWSNQSTASGGVSSASPGYSGPGAQFGGIIDEPIVGIGMHSGREWRLGESGSELVTPLNQIQGGGGLGNIIINIGNITKEADYMKLKPLIQRWILEASSRRGMV